MSKPKSQKNKRKKSIGMLNRDGNDCWFMWWLYYYYLYFAGYWKWRKKSLKRWLTAWWLTHTHDTHEILFNPSILYRFVPHGPSDTYNSDVFHFVSFYFQNRVPTELMWYAQDLRCALQSEDEFDHEHRHWIEFENWKLNGSSTKRRKHKIELKVKRDERESHSVDNRRKDEKKNRKKRLQMLTATFICAHVCG